MDFFQALVGYVRSEENKKLLDIKKVGNDYAVFVSDSGHRGSTKDYGYGTGWYSINEFTGQKIASYTVVSENGRRT